MRDMFKALVAIAIALPTSVALPVLTPANAQVDTSGCVFQPYYHNGIAPFTFFCTDTYDTRAECERALVPLRTEPGAAGSRGGGGRTIVDDFERGAIVTHCEELEDGSYLLETRR